VCRELDHSWVLRNEGLEKLNVSGNLRLHRNRRRYGYNAAVTVRCLPDGFRTVVSRVVQSQYKATNRQLEFAPPGSAFWVRPEELRATVNAGRATSPFTFQPRKGVLLCRLLRGAQSAAAQNKPISAASEFNDLLRRIERRLGEVETVRHVVGRTVALID
jgi:hypothetical protein